MKKRLTGYTFDASEKTVTHADFSDLTLEGIQLITNTTDQVIIYNFADSAKGGTLSTDTLTLEHDTTSMDDTDKLMILVDDAVTTQPISAASLPLPSGAATSVKQDDQTTALQLLDDTVYVDDADWTDNTSKHLLVGGVYQSTQHTVTDGDVSPLAVDDNGNLRVNIMAGGGSGGTSAADDADFTDGTTAGTPAMGVYESTPTTVTDGDLGVVGITEDRSLKVQPPSITSGAGAVGATTPRMTLASDDPGVALLGTIDSDTGNIATAVQIMDDWDESDRAKVNLIAGQAGVQGGAGTVSANTQRIALATDANAVKITDGTDTLDVLDLTNSNPAAVAIVDGDGTQITSFGGGTQYTEDAAAAANPVGTALNLIRADTLAGVTTTDGDNVAARGTDKGELYVKVADQIDAQVNNTVDVNIAGYDAPVEVSVVDPVQLGSGSLVTVENPGGGSAVNIQDGGNSITVDGTVTASIAAGATTIAKAEDVASADADVGIPAMAVRKGTPANTSGTDGDYEMLQMSAGRLWTSATVTGTVTVDGSGVTQPVSHAALTELAAAIDTEVQVDIVGALPAGTNAIGKLAANSGVDIGDVTLTAGTEAIGKLLAPDIDVTTHTNYAKKYYTNAGAVTDGIVWSPAAGKRWHVVSMFINVSAAATITLEDDKSGGDEAIMKMELAANSGTVVNFGEKYPLASGEDAADLLVTTSAGNVYITTTGYEI
jgi:hypothetical protein